MAKQEAVSARAIVIGGVILLTSGWGSATALAAAKAKPQVWVSKSDGSVQCEKALPAGSLEQEQAALEKVGVRVFQAKKMMNQMIVIALCGAPTGNENSYLISEGDFEKAEKSGFKKSKK